MIEKLELLTDEEIERMFRCNPDELCFDMLVRDPRRLVIVSDASL